MPAPRRAHIEPLCKPRVPSGSDPIVTRGFQSDPIAEHAALTEIAYEVGLWWKAEAEARRKVRKAIDNGVRARVIAEQLGWSRATLYRWLNAG